MKTNRSEPKATASISRRDILKTSATLAGAGLIAGMGIARFAHAAGSDAIKVGLIGCGGRGCGAAANILNAGKDIRLTAMADLYEEKVKIGLQNLRKLYPDQVAVGDDRRFSGFDAYRQLLATDIDVALIATPIHFHPYYLQAAVDAGKHVFCEKAHALDVPGIRTIEAACEKARQKNLSVLSGFCWRYSPAVRETMKRVEDGAIGEIVAIQCNYVVTPYNVVERRPGWSELDYQLRNWYHFDWLSGDQIAAQLIHCLDHASWAMYEKAPTKAWGMGGRQVLVDPAYGDQFDHFSAIYEYENGVRVFAYCRNMLNCYNEYSTILLGTKGRAFMPYRCRIEGEKRWRYAKPDGNMYDFEQLALVEAIRKGQPINSGGYMATSSMLAILGKMACYTGQEITWERARESTQDYRLPKYDWDAVPPVKPGMDGRYPCALPGITPFV